jgi:hypothetical protein
MLEQKCRAKFKTCKKERCIVHSKDMHALYIDDLSEAEAIELKRQLVDATWQYITITLGQGGRVHNQ